MLWLTKAVSPPEKSEAAAGVETAAAPSANAIRLTCAARRRKDLNGADCVVIFATLLLGKGWRLLCAKPLL